MSGTIRLFIAVELPDRVKREIAGLEDGLRNAQLPGVRLVRSDGVHLTLKFLGNVSEDRVGPIEATVGSAAREHDSFELKLGNPGVFPGGDAPRVLWVGVEGQLARLHSLHQVVEGALEGDGFQREARDFHPHLTVARIRDGTSRADRRRAKQVLTSFGVRSGLTIPVESLSLMRSTTLPDGAVHERLASMSLSGGPGR